MWNSGHRREGRATSSKPPTFTGCARRLSTAAPMMRVSTRKVRWAWACAGSASLTLAGGKQPIHNEDKTVWVVFNGEIYNFPELRREFEEPGPPVLHPQRHRGDRPSLRRDGRGLC